MMRRILQPVAYYIAVALPWLLVGYLALTGFVKLADALAAPVPKAPEVKTLTPEMMVGTWDYSWGGWENGVITLSADGTYYAQHVPGSDTAYAGTWRIENGNTVVLTEYGYKLSTGERYSGPTDYHFEFTPKDYPALAGLSNRSVRVGLKNPKR